MINFQEITLDTFLREYWQKKPLVIRNALPHFIAPISADELAGLALEEDMESRIVWETPSETPQWHLRRGPFVESDFSSLPNSHWTLLVQGIDRVVPEAYQLLDHFNFIPQWRIDDLMISYAAMHGSVGPHYDNYDVFLFQAQGRREWKLTAQQCNPDNYIPNLELRIMNEFQIEDQFILEKGDMLYLPPHIGHYGISQSEHCMTYSFGYRSYQGQEMLDSLADYFSEKECFKKLYQDPDWSDLQHTSEINDSAWKQASQLLQQVLTDKDLMRAWFASFATRLDQQAEQQLPLALEADEVGSLADFGEELSNSSGLFRDASCRFAYHISASSYDLYVNGCAWHTANVTPALIVLIANNRFIPMAQLAPYINDPHNQLFLFELWELQWLQIVGDSDA